MGQVYDDNNNRNQIMSAKLYGVRITDLAGQGPSEWSQGRQGRPVKPATEGDHPYSSLLDHQDPCRPEDLGEEQMCQSKSEGPGGFPNHLRLPCVAFLSITTILPAALSDQNA